MASLTPLRSLLQRRRVARELDDELTFHVEMETQANVARGLSPDEARRLALADFGDVERTREAVLDVRSLAVDSLWQDIRSAARTLTVAPGFTIAAAGMLALAIGITTAMFTVVDALVLRPVPFRDAGQLAEVQLNYDWGGPGLGLTPAVLQAWQESPAFEAAEWARSDTALIEVGDTVVALGVATVTPGVFEMLGGVRPLRGRLFYPTEGRPSERDRVIVSETVWRAVFGADPAFVGQRITVDGEPLTVVGILPAAFRFPASDTGLWRPIDVAGAPEQLRIAYARFATDIPRDDAVRLATEAARAADAGNSDRRLWVNPLSDGLRDAYSTRAVAVLAGGIVLVFLVLCTNVCGLMLARLTTRRGEFGVRAALGAARGRLMRQAFVESAVLGTLGAAFGTSVAWLLVSIARALIPQQVLVQTLNALGLDGRALAAASIAGLVAMLATSLLPAWLGTRVDAGDSLRGRNSHGTQTRGARNLARGLPVAEVALACTLLAGATLLTRSFANLATADRGLDTSGVTTLWLDLTSIDSENTAAIAALTRTVEDELRGLPGARQLAWSYGVPPRGGFQDEGQWISDVPGASAVSVGLSHYMVSPEFFSIYGIPIIRGRNFASSDGAEVIVSERLARAISQDADPVGHTVRYAQQHFGVGPDGQSATLGDEQILRVVGIARDIRFPSISSQSGLDRPAVYHPYSPVSTPMVSLRCEPVCDIAAIRHRLASTLPADVRVQSARPGDADYVAALVRPRATAALALAFAVVALLAAAMGLFSVLSYGVNSRRREFGIRIALGASPSEIRNAVFRDGLFVLIAGLGVGSLFAVLLARALSALQYGVSAGDPVSLGIVVGTIGLTTIVAAWRPARIAGRIDPAQLLREE